MKSSFLLIQKYRKTIILVFVLISLAALWQLRKLQINSDILATLPDDDPVAELYHQIGEEFGGNDLGMMVIHHAEIFDKTFLHELADITDSIAFIPGVSRVTSLINVLDVKDNGFGIEITPLIDRWNIPESPEALLLLKKYVLQNEFYRSNLISSDGKSTMIIFTLQQDADKEQIIKQIREKSEQFNFNGAELYFGGLPVLMNDVNTLIINDIVRLTPVVIVLILTILFFGFKSFSLAIMPLISACIAVLWSLGLMATFGFQLSVISDVIPVVLIAVGSAYTIHVINALVLGDSTNSKNAINNLQSITLPVTLSSVTTIIGFISFIFGAYLNIIRDFGIFSAIGSLVALACAIILVPAVYFEFPSLSKKYRSASYDRPKGQLLLNRLAGVVTKQPKLIISIWLIALLIVGAGYFRLQTSVNMTRYFKKEFASRQAEEMLQKEFGGSMPVFILFEGDVQSPEMLEAMWKAEHFMKEDNHVEVSQSVASLIARMNEVMGEGRTIPDEREKIEQLWFLLEGQEEMRNLVNDGLDKAVIQSRFASIHTRDIIAFTEKMNRYVADYATENVKMRFTGIAPVYYKLNNSLINSQISSLVIALGLVLVFVSVMLSSAKKGAMATVPVLVTSLMMPGLMGLTGIPLDVATVLVGSLALGIGIDYAIHIGTAYDKHRQSGYTPDQSITKALTQSGRAVAINVLSVGLGFWVLLFSELVPLQHFGVLVAIGMFVAGMSALSLLPAILLTIDRKLTK